MGKWRDTQTEVILEGRHAQGCFRPDRMRDRKRKTAFFDLEFFDQKNKAILCARILAISEQHFLI